MQIYDQKKTSAKIVQKSDLGVSWAPFGKGLGRSGASWGHFWAHFDCLLDVPNHIFLKQWSKMGSKRPFGWLLDRFLGRFGCVLGEFGHSKLKLLRHMVISLTLWVSPAASHFATRTPALPRFASRSVTIENFCEKVSENHRKCYPQKVS